MTPATSGRSPRASGRRHGCCGASQIGATRPPMECAMKTTLASVLPLFSFHDASHVRTLAASFRAETRVLRRQSDRSDEAAHGVRDEDDLGVRVAAVFLP